MTKEFEISYNLNNVITTDTNGNNEGERKEDVIYKIAKIVEEIARKYSATLVVGDTYRGKDRMASNIRKNLRHRIYE